MARAGLHRNDIAQRVETVRSRHARGRSGAFLPLAVAALVAAFMGAAVCGAVRRADPPESLDPRDPHIRALLEQASQVARARHGDAAPMLQSETAPDLPSGAVCTIVGRIDQVTDLDEDADGTRLVEWFVRLPGGEPVLVLVSIDGTVAFDIGDRVELRALAAGSIEAVTRSGERRRYAAFVGAHPVHPGVEVPVMTLLLIMGPALLLLLVLFAIAATMAARSRRGRRIERALDRTAETLVPGDATESPVEALLPSDPIEALEALWSRTQVPGQQPQRDPASRRDG